MKELLEKLKMNKGKIVSSASCTELEITQAQACERFYIDDEGCGFVYFPEHPIKSLPDDALADVLEFISNELENGYELRKMFYNYCIQKMGNNLEALDKADRMVTSITNIFYSKEQPIKSVPDDGLSDAVNEWCKGYHDLFIKCARKSFVAGWQTKAQQEDKIDKAIQWCDRELIAIQNSTNREENDSIKVWLDGRKFSISTTKQYLQQLKQK